MKRENFAKLKSLVEQIAQMVEDESQRTCRLVDDTKFRAGKGDEWANINDVCDRWIDMSEDFKSAVKNLEQLETFGDWIEWEGLP